MDIITIHVSQQGEGGSGNPSGTFAIGQGAGGGGSSVL